MTSGRSLHLSVLPVINRSGRCKLGEAGGDWEAGVGAQCGTLSPAGVPCTLGSAGHGAGQLDRNAAGVRGSDQADCLCSWQPGDGLRAGAGGRAST